MVKEADNWRPTKAEPHKRGWRASRDVREVGLGSRAVADWSIAAYQEAIQAHACGALVDLGCGSMPYFGIYRPYTTEVIGIDWPETRHKAQHVDVFCDLNERVDLADARADTVLCTDVVEHIYKPAKLWSEMSRILRPGGKAIVSAPFFYWLHETPYDFHRYTRYAFERYVADAGLELVSITEVGGLPHVMTDLLCKATQRVGLISEFIRLCACASLRIPPVRKLADATAAKFPLVYLVVAAKPA